MPAMIGRKGRHRFKRTFYRYHPDAIFKRCVRIIKQRRVEKAKQQAVQLWRRYFKSLSSEKD